MSGNPRAERPPGTPEMEKGRMQGIQEIDLRVTGRNGKSSSVRVKPGKYLIGRGSNCHIRLPAQNRAVSRHHARLEVDSRTVRVEDLESDTGTMVNGKIIRIALLESRDTISIAGYNLEVIIPEQERAWQRSGQEVYAAGGDAAPPESVESLIADLKDLNRATRRLVDAVAQRIVGQERIVRSIWATMLAKGHCLLVGVPGLAKTLMVSTFAEVLGLKTKRIQFTPDLLPSDIIGSNVIHESEDGKRYFEFVQGPIFTQLLLADEINRTPPKTQAALLEAMQERQVTVADKSLSLPEPFFVIATQNPIEQEGTYPLPEAQQDRFMLCLHLDYPSREEEIEILLRTSTDNGGELAELLSLSDILRYQDLAAQIVVSGEIAAYCADLVRATRPAREEAPDWLRSVVDWGAGPRAGQALIRIAKATAAMDGRPAISRDDVLEALEPVLRHRVACNFRARAEGLDESAIVQRIVTEVPYA